MADNKVKFGLSKCYYATVTETGDVTTYGSPVAMPGAVALNLEAQMSQEPFHADNGVYYVTSTANSYEGDLEIAAVPTSFLKDIFGDVEDANGAIVEIKESTPKYFALMFETEGDVGGHRTVMYKCSATRPALGSKTTEDSVEVQTSTMSIKAIARVDSDTVSGKTGHAIQSSLNEGDTGYSSFFSAVYAPTSSAPTVKYTITYNANGGTGTISPVEVVAGQSTTLSDGTGLTAPEGKVFAGWATTSTAESADVTSPYTPAASVTLYAVWDNAA